MSVSITFGFALGFTFILAEEVDVGGFVVPKILLKRPPEFDLGISRFAGIFVERGSFLPGKFLKGGSVLFEVKLAVRLEVRFGGTLVKELDRNSVFIAASRSDPRFEFENELFR